MKLYEERDTPGAQLGTEFTLFLLRPPGTMMSRGSCHRADLPNTIVPEGQTLIEGWFPDNSVYLNGHVIDGPPPRRMATSANVKAMAARLLSRTDWYVMRAHEDPSKPMPEEIRLRRNRIRERSNELEAQLLTTPMTLDELGLESTWALDA